MAQILIFSFSYSYSSISPSPFFLFLLRIDFCTFQVTYIDFKVVTPGVQFCINFYSTHIANTIFNFLLRGNARSLCDPYVAKLDFLLREDARNLHMIRIFYLEVRFLFRVNAFFDRQKKAI